MNNKQSSEYSSTPQHDNDHFDFVKNNINKTDTSTSNIFLEEQKKNIISKIEEALEIRDKINKKINSADDEILNIEAHIQGILSACTKEKKENFALKPATSFIPNYHINNFPLFIKNIKYILAIFSIGVPTKYPLRGNKIDKVFYTVGYKSKRLYFKHRHHPIMDDDFIIYHCKTLYDNNILVFEVKTDDGLFLCGDNKTVYTELKDLVNFPFAFGSLEEFFGMMYDETINLIKEKYDLGCRKMKLNMQ